MFITIIGAGAVGARAAATSRYGSDSGSGSDQMMRLRSATLIKRQWDFMKTMQIVFFTVIYRRNDRSWSWSWSWSRSVNFDKLEPEMEPELEPETKTNRPAQHGFEQLSEREYRYLKTFMKSTGFREIFYLYCVWKWCVRSFRQESDEEPSNQRHDSKEGGRDATVVLRQHRNVRCHL
jgi:hypothetical protein